MSSPKCDLNFIAEKSLGVEKDLNNNNNESLTMNNNNKHDESDLSLKNPSQNHTKSHAYENSYLESYSIDLNDPRRESIFFFQDHPVNIQIIAHEQESSLVLLHTTVYIINITHAGHTWSIKRRFKNFLKLYETYALFKAKLNIKNVAVSAHLTANTTLFNTGVQASTASNNENLTQSKKNNSKFKPSDHFKLLFQSIAADFSQAKNILEKFLQDVVDHKTFRNHNETLKFLEVSHLSFIGDLGDKNKEGIVKKRSFNIGFCQAISFNLFWDSRWLVVKDTWIGFLDPRTGAINSVILVDQGFRVMNGIESTGARNGLLIENLSRNLLLKCYNEKRAHEWRLSILNMTFSSAEKFFNMQRFGSFAPVRNNSQAKWFVDGSDYMESVAESIESAKEEIFITGFFLSPEIYLKRPVIVGDRWRLDKLLQRKAEEGVKIYILIYKEIELTLPINSAYSKRIFTLTHKNIKVLRHPDHINEPNQFFTIMWAHHEKLVIIDQSVAYFGGIDLCYGRWDNHLHKLTDMGSVLPSNGSIPHNHHHHSVNLKETLSCLSAEADNSKSNTVRLIGYKSIRSISIQNSVDESNQCKSSASSNLLENRSNLIQSTNYNTITSHQKITNKQAESNLRLTSGKDKISPVKSDLHFDETVSIINYKKIDAVEENQEFKSRTRRLKAMQVFSSPTGSFDKTTNHFIKRKEADSDTDDQSEEYLLYKTNLKRSKSLDMSSASRHENELSHSISESSGLTLTHKEFLNKKFKIFKNSIKSNTQNMKIFNREYGELPILNKLKKIKQFKDNIKRYTFKLNNNNSDNNSELNSSIDQHDEETNRCFEPSSSEQLLNHLQGSTKYWIGKDYCNFIHKDVKDVHSPFKDSIDRTSVPRMPWHDIGGCVCGPAARDIARHFIQRWNYVKMKKVRNNKNYVFIVPKAYTNYTIPPKLASKCSNCTVQVLRSVSTWSAGISKTESSIHEAMKHLIRTSKHYIYIENQFFISSIGDNSVLNEIAECLYERIVKAAKERSNFKVYILLPLIPGYEGEYGKSSGVLLHAITHYNNSSLDGLIKKLSDASIEALNYLCFFSLRTWSELNDKLVTELIYVHSKLMIVDDRASIIGSANINDRSLLGNRDSEVALYVEDTQFINGVLNKKQCEVGRFNSTLRQRLFKEFLGEFPNINTGSASYMINASESMPILSSVLTPRKLEQNHFRFETAVDVSDPCSDEFYKQVLLKYAAQNTRSYDLVFKAIPCDYVSNFQQLKEYQKQTCFNQKNRQESLNELSKIKGYIVLYPYRFLCYEDLTPPLGTKENLMPSTLFT